MSEFTPIPHAERMHGQRHRSGAWSVEVLRYEAGSWGVFVTFEGRTLTVDDVERLMPNVADAYLETLPYVDALRVGRRVAAQLPRS